MNTDPKQKGFSYLDVMVGVTILLVGVLALVAAITAAVVRTNQQELQLRAKQYAYSTIEAIFSARDINTLGWDAIGNVGNNVVGGVAKGIFLTGQQPIRLDPGNAVVVPGTAADTGTPIIGFQRQITITDICDPDRPSSACNPAGNNKVMSRQITVTIFYQVGNSQFQETVSTVISNFMK
jgi:type II secretory pathway pseudopilin PulG